MPPHLAGREREYAEFDRLLGQDQILENLVLPQQSVEFRVLALAAGEVRWHMSRPWSIGILELR